MTKRFLMTFLISMVPIVELRGGLPFGIVSGLSLPVAVVASVLGSMIPIPFILLLIEKIFIWMRETFPKMDGFITRLEKRAKQKQQTVDRFGAFGLILLVAIPLPGTGAWTGALVAALMRMEMQKALPCIFIGVIIAAGIMIGVTYLGIVRFF